MRRHRLLRHAGKRDNIVGWICAPIRLIDGGGPGIDLGRRGELTAQGTEDCVEAADTCEEVDKRKGHRVRLAGNTDTELPHTPHGPTHPAWT